MDVFGVLGYAGYVLLCLKIRLCFVYPSYILTPFSRDFCFARHSSSKLDSALAYRKNS